MSFHRPTEQDVEQIREMLLDPITMRFQGGVLSRDESLAFIDYAQKHWDRFGFGHYAASLKDDGLLVGLFSVKHLAIEEASGPPDLGFFIRTELWNRGLATEGALGLLKYATTTLGFRTIAAFNYPMNRRSVRVLEKLGFVPHGTKELHYRGRSYGEGTHWLYETLQCT